MIIESFSILDFKTKEARTFDFKSGTNLIISNGNTEGKSSLLKSLYYTLGFDVRQFPSGWNKDDMYFQITVDINNQEYNITRQKDLFRVSDSTEIMNVKEYSEWLSKKLNTHMELPNVYTKELHTAYSSALILPFYIDQDDSWEGVLYKKVTDTLNQYSGIPKNIFEDICCKGWMSNPLLKQRRLAHSQRFEPATQRGRDRQAAWSERYVHPYISSSKIELAAALTRKDVSPLPPTTPVGGARTA